MGVGALVSSHVYTILFTDIEGSTRLWEQEGERMAAALAQHDARAHAAVEGNHGTIVKTTGDGLYAVFSDPLDAVNAAVLLQQSLVDPAVTSGIPVRVRCGLHLGVVERRDNDFFGSPVNRTARIMSVALGGQILLSEAVVDEVRERLPIPVTLRDLGSVRLKDLSTPEHVYQVLHPDLRQDFPALRSLEATPNNLPQQLTSFIGREHEVAKAEELLKTTHLLTLFGMGGLGKTRLSLQIAADTLGAHPDGVWFVDLAPIRDPSLVADTLAQVLGVREEPGKPLASTLCAHLKPLKTLLILDNCEHLVAACADLANALLRAAPNVRIIATTREVLRVPGEQTFPVLPLALPDRAASVEALSRSEAVQLFLDRAQLQKPGFALNEKEAPAVAELCARLEGIPLALELAAARMRSMSIQDINKRLNDRFKLLTSGGRVLLERQQTLRALVVWSYDLLTESEQRLLERLSVFVGGFDLEAAETVCGADPLAPEDVLDLVTSLIEKSLVMVDELESGTRYRQLETIRDFAREYLNQREDAAATAVRHCDHYLLVAKAAKQGLEGTEQAEWTKRVEAELDNLRVAILLALDGEVDPVLAVKFEVALMGFWMLRGYFTEGRNYVRAALALPAVQASDVAHAHALYVGAALADAQGDHLEALRMLEACLALRRGTGNPVEVAAALSLLSLVRLHAGDATSARESEEEAVEIFRELGNRIGEGIGLVHLGEICAYVADDTGAQRHFEQCLAIARELRYWEMESECERLLGELALESGDVAGARSRFARSLEICRGAGDKRGEATALWWIGKADLAVGDAASARTRFDEALHAFQAFEMNAEMLGCLEDHARLLQSVGCVDAAVCLYGAVEKRREAMALSRPPRRAQRWHEHIAAARSALGESAFEASWAVGQGWGIADLIRFAQSKQEIALPTAA
jgi:predicted ATPase/class 3 adenylate cyclase